VEKQIESFPSYFFFDKNLYDTHERRVGISEVNSSLAVGKAKRGS
jgi:hypothetical protein